jgi:hypothetical protein
MPFQFTCPYCFKKTFVDEAIAGQSGPCAGCGKTITVPEPPAKIPGNMRPIGQSQDIHSSGHTVRARQRLLVWLLQIASVAIGMVALSAVAMYLLWPTLEGLRVRRDQATSLNNLQRIATALNNYAAEYGSYPPAVVRDANGTPLYSWRVLILEQLDEAHLAANFRRDLPWNSAENSSLAARCPSVFVPPRTSSQGVIATAHYALITGRNTIFPGPDSLSPSDIGDGTDRTILVAEVDLAGGEWAEPWDIDSSKMATTVGFGGTNAIGGNYEQGAAVVFADGTPAWLPANLSPALLRGLISPNGNETIDPAPYIKK